MKRSTRLILLCVGIIALLAITAILLILPADKIRTPVYFPTLTGPYLGQDPPAAVPIPFAKDIIGEDIHATVVFSPDGTEVYWRPFQETSDEILFMNLENGVWSPAQVVPFSSRISDSDDPCLSTDGSRLYFTSWRPPRWWQVFGQKERIWYVERTTQGWSRPEPVSEAVNDMELHWQLSVSDDETLYFASDGDIFEARYQNGKHQGPEKLGRTINSLDREGHPWVAPDGSFLIFSSNRSKDNPGDFDLYLSWRSSQGGWGEPVNLGERINTPAVEIYPVLSPDLHYLFFLRARSSGLSVYWVDFEAIIANLQDGSR